MDAMARSPEGTLMSYQQSEHMAAEWIRSHHAKRIAHCLGGMLLMLFAGALIGAGLVTIDAAQSVPVDVWGCPSINHGGLG